MSGLYSIARVVIEGIAASRGLDAIGARLESSTDGIAGRMNRAADTPSNRRAARHVVAMERWGAHRLRAGLALAGGASGPELDESDRYAPPDELPLEGLAQEFLEARADTLALLDPVRENPGCRIPHNDLGPISGRAWLFYLDSHARMESSRIS